MPQFSTRLCVFGAIYRSKASLDFDLFGTMPKSTCCHDLYFSRSAPMFLVGNNLKIIDYNVGKLTRMWWIHFATRKQRDNLGRDHQERPWGSDCRSIRQTDHNGTRTIISWTSRRQNGGQLSTDPRGCARDAHPSVQILSFSCSF